MNFIHINTTFMRFNEYGLKKFLVTLLLYTFKLQITDEQRQNSLLRYCFVEPQRNILFEVKDTSFTTLIKSGTLRTTFVGV